MIDPERLAHFGPDQADPEIHPDLVDLVRVLCAHGVYTLDCVNTDVPPGEPLALEVCVRGLQ
ncbi:MAG: hypothetical protein KIT58_23350, partial [Planctomycetota bacterium]|nr:hypothetical protein [Planctomycetota bacterium]